MHLGGFAAEDDEGNAGATLLVDTHSTPIAEPVWHLYAHAVRCFGLQPSLIEWDNELPALATILQEAVMADSMAANALERSRQHASAC